MRAPVWVSCVMAAWMLAQHACATAQAQAQDATVTVHMRETGYVLGDLIEQRIELQAGSSKIVRNSLPAPGRVNNWLELRAARIEDRSHLRLTYQVFGAVEQALTLEIPAFKLRLRTGQEETVLVVPAAPFVLSPVLPATLSENDRVARSAPPPKPGPERWLLGAALVCAALSAALALYLAWIHDRLPFLSRRAGPLTRLFRRLRRPLSARAQQPVDLDVLRDVQAAFNTCAGETLYEATLPLLFARAPHLAPLREDIEAFFEYSRESFYGASLAPRPASELLALCRRARDCERGLR